MSRMHGRPFTAQQHPELARLARAQASAVTRGQLSRIGIDDDPVRFHLRGERWREVAPGVLVLHCGPLPLATLRWVALLAAGPCAALAAWTAIELQGVRGWSRPGVHIVVPRGRHVPALPGVVVHESRRHGPADIAEYDGIPTHRLERAAVDAASWSGQVRTACGLMAAVVQQRLSQPERLRVAVDEAGRIRFRKQLFWALVDIEGGAEALSEIDIARLCRDAGLPEPVRQRVRLDVHGRRRYLDAEWDLPDGGVLILEIDGIGHMDPTRWYDDLMREAELVIDRPHRVIRLPATAARLERARVQAVLARALGRPLPALSPLRPVSTWPGDSQAWC
jgi:hypothetical protein